MANWCYNTVEFTGEEIAVKKIMELFASMEQKENETKVGQLPDFITCDDGYFFSLCGYSENSLSYETKWSPNIGNVVEIAKKFDVNFIMTYEELGSNIFGKAIYTAGNDEVVDYYLTDEDFNRYDWNDEEGYYLFDGVEYESSDDILMDIFKEKFGFDF